MKFLETDDAYINMDSIEQIFVDDEQHSDLRSRTIKVRAECHKNTYVLYSSDLIPNGDRAGMVKYRVLAKVICHAIVTRMNKTNESFSVTGAIRDLLDADDEKSAEIDSRLILTPEPVAVPEPTIDVSHLSEAAQMLALTEGKIPIRGAKVFGAFPAIEQESNSN